MGQKVNPTSFRLGNIFSWKSRWFATPADYSDKVLEDYRLRKYFNSKLHNAGLVQINIERSISKMRIILHVSRPGVVIGKGGANLEEIKKEVEKLLNTAKLKKEQVHVDLKVEEVKNPDLSAKLVGERIINQLIGRYPHRRAISQALEKVMAAGAKGIKIQLSGRIGGAEIGRQEKYFKGSIPTQTLRANIDYFESPAKTRSGYVGVKVWIYKGEIV
ncbi:MAG: 30S ribosomal protein S3 [Candidatus Pacebacteria bacterium RIFOXYB1_FULL_39_46]|nr:MAG: 30S ribosomal protein S3 [Candidatus Pacebacteria bacterium RIFOXYB1_FULL_39_46]OGJ39009.1 MAG: 30S ribosomal protein S3 [Candidatus Pacebacteria bacterium RIFOXYA1_FULL_38_18]OGJ39980.1 MAG: 30S ribosomal protein S3 [Candidatus Pacebacteria bacterium RIFOXYD1_FULL_39_27]OGJ40758.1 MAG: 30S ribosomal protein S3 [Candidatus Pacebacteria bacterium RIFOXYC1_FULL_39_21]